MQDKAHTQVKVSLSSRGSAKEAERQPGHFHSTSSQKVSSPISYQVHLQSAHLLKSAMDLRAPHKRQKSALPTRKTNDLGKNWWGWGSQRNSHSSKCL